MHDEVKRVTIIVLTEMMEFANEKVTESYLVHFSNIIMSDLNPTLMRCLFFYILFPLLF